MQQVFISSTQKDLEKYRLDVRDEILRAGCFPIAMEYLAADGDTPPQVCYDKVQEADIFIGIYAERYGYIPGPEVSYTPRGESPIACDGQTGITELEYQWAVQKGIPILIFIARNNPDPLLKQHQETDPAIIEKLTRFKERVAKQHTIAFFKDGPTLIQDVARSLAETLKDFEKRERRRREFTFQLTIGVTGALLLLLIGFGVWRLFFVDKDADDRVAQLSPPLSANLSLLRGESLNDVAAGSAYVWLGGQGGLYVYEIDTEQTRQVANLSHIRSVTTNDDGSLVWFSFTVDGVTAFGETMGRMGAAPTATLELFSPVINGQKVEDWIFSVKREGDLIYWGSATNGVFYETGDGWQQIQPDEVGPNGINDLTQMPNSDGLVQPGVLWTTNYSLLYRWENGWQIFNSDTTDGQLSFGVRGIVFDDAGNLWVGHSTGVSVLPNEDARTAAQTDDDWILCTADNSPLPEGEALSMTSTNGGKTIWIITKEGAASIEQGGALTTNCAGWDWQVWEKQAGGQTLWDTTLTEAVMVASESSEPTNNDGWIWIIKTAEDEIAKIRIH